MKKMAFCDIETYKDFFQIGFMIDDEYISLDCRYNEIFGRVNQNKLNWILQDNTIVTFNGLAFDNVFINILSANYNLKPIQLYIIANYLINNEYNDELITLTHKHFNNSISKGLLRLNHNDYNIFNIGNIFNIKNSVKYQTIDLYKINNAGGLKFYGANLGLKIRELPYKPDSNLNNYQIDEIIAYNENDLIITKSLYEKSIKDIDFREQLNEKYDVDVTNHYKDFRNMGDAKIGEFFVNSTLKPTTNLYLNKTITSFKANIPNYIKFEDEYLNSIVDKIRNYEFKLNNYGSLIKPKWIKDIEIDLAGCKFNLEIGGLHSKENKLKVTSSEDDNTILRNIDVTSYYPSMQFCNSFEPHNVKNGSYVDLGLELFDERQIAKKIEKKLTKINRERELTNKEIEELNNNKIINATNKIILNGGMYGKLGDNYCRYYDPKVMVNITLTGQLSLLMLIEQLDKLAGVEILSSNTDGIEIKHYQNITSLGEIKRVVTSWEIMTGLNMEYGEYKALYARDVNAYIANYGKYTKAKGIYASSSSNIHKKILYPIVFEAIEHIILNEIEDINNIKKELYSFIGNKDNALIEYVTVNKVNAEAILVDDINKVKYNPKIPKLDKKGNKIYGVIPKSKRIKINNVNIKKYAEDNNLVERYYWSIYDKNNMKTEYKIINGSNFNYYNFKEVGKIVRFAYTKKDKNILLNKKSSNKIANSNNIKILDNHLDTYKNYHEWLDINRYVTIAIKELKEIAYI